jgi:hypothetical protein
MGEEGKVKNGRVSTISKYKISVQVEDITICIESCRIMGGGRAEGRVKEGVELTKVR